MATATSARAARATVLMRAVLREVGRIELPDAKITLRMAQGLHSGTFHFFAVGDSHLELLATGPAWSRLVAMQHGAAADEIVASPETCAALAPECLGETKEPGRLLLREPPGEFAKMPLRPRPQMAPEAVARCLPTAVREHLRDANALPEHRPVTVAFIRYGGTDALIEQPGQGRRGQRAPAAIDDRRARPPKRRTSRSSPPTSTPTEES